MGRRHRHLNPRDAGAFISLDTRWATTATLPNRAQGSGISFSQNGSPTFASGGQGGNNRLTTTATSGLFSGTFNASTYFPGNTSTIITCRSSTSVGAGADHYAFYMSYGTTFATDTYAGIGYASSQAYYDWGILIGGPPAPGRIAVADSIASGEASINSSISTGSSRLGRKNGVQVGTGAGSASLVSNANYRAVVGMYYSNGTSIFDGRNPLTFYAAMAVPGNNLAVTKRLEHSLAYSFKLPCS